MDMQVNERHSANIHKTSDLLRGRTLLIFRKIDFFTFFSAAFLRARIVASYIIGVPIMMEAYVPMQIPRQRATDRPLMDSPPKIAIASIGRRVDTEVLTVRVRVALSDLLTVR